MNIMKLTIIAAFFLLPSFGMMIAYSFENAHTDHAYLQFDDGGQSFDLAVSQ